MPEDVRSSESPLREFAEEMLRDAPCGIAVADPDGRILYLNKTLIRWRDENLTNTTCGLGDLFDAPGRIYTQTHVLPILRLQGFVREISCHLRRGDGSIRPVLLNAIMRKAADGTPTRIDVMFLDATERSQYEAQLRAATHEAEELAAIVRTSRSVVIRTDGRGRIRRWNEEAARVGGIDDESYLEKFVQDLFVMVESATWFDDFIAGHDNEEEETKDFQHVSGRYFSMTIAPIGANGRTGPRPDYSIIMRDITSRKTADEHLRVVVQELNHRFKNVLSVVMGIARQTLGGQEAKAFANRIHALSQAHDLLTTANVENVDLSRLLEITRQEAGGPNRMTLRAPRVALAPREATGLSMALHEMTTNALKYGALSNEVGTVSIRCSLDAGDSQRLTIQWRESGGPPVTPPKNVGFGTKLLQKIFATDLNATIHMDYPPAGFICDITWTLAIATAPDA